MMKVMAHLSKELREKYKRRSFGIRVGDKVRVMRGFFKGMIGKVTKVDRERGRILIEGVEREKVDGSKVPVPIHASKVEIIELNVVDKWRKKKRGGKVEKGG